MPGVKGRSIERVHDHQLSRLQMTRSKIEVAHTCFRYFVSERRGSFTPILIYFAKNKM